MAKKKAARPVQARTRTPPKLKKIAKRARDSQNAKRKPHFYLPKRTTGRKNPDKNNKKQP